MCNCIINCKPYEPVMFQCAMQQPWLLKHVAFYIFVNVCSWIFFCENEGKSNLEPFKKHFCGNIFAKILGTVIMP